VHVRRVRRLEAAVEDDDLDRRLRVDTERVFRRLLAAGLLLL
jgi:hypothetical protein